MRRIKPDFKRMAGHSDEMLQYVGQTVTWRQYVGTGSANVVAGFQPEPIYRERQITAFIGQGMIGPGALQLRQDMQPVGQMVAGEVGCVTREKLSTEDELIWNDVYYRVESQPVHSPFGNNWFAVLKRGDDD